jgi:hypothetical protein
MKDCLMVNVARFLAFLLLSIPAYNTSPFVGGFAISSSNVATGHNPLTDGMSHLKHRDRFVALSMLKSNENDNSVEEPSSLSSQRRAFFHRAVGTLVSGSVLSSSPQGAMAAFPDMSTMNGGKADKSKSKTRLGGLPNKIRSIGQVLVSFSFTWFYFIFHMLASYASEYVQLMCIFMKLIVYTIYLLLWPNRLVDSFCGWVYIISLLRMSCRGI